MRIGRAGMIKKRRKIAAAFTLIEAVVASVVLVVAVIGASGYRYYAAVDVRKAGLQRTAAAIALTLCENWRGRGYDHIADFDPVVHLSPEMDITASDVGPGVATGWTKLGSYRIIVDNAYYWVTLAWKEISTPAGLRALNVVVGWKPAGSKAEITTYNADAKLFKLTTYVAN